MRDLSELFAILGTGIGLACAWLLMDWRKRARRRRDVLEMQVAAWRAWQQAQTHNEKSLPGVYDGKDR